MHELNTNLPQIPSSGESGLQRSSSPLIDAKFTLVDSVINAARSVSVDDGGISIRDALDAWRYAVQHFSYYDRSLSHAKVYGEEPAEDMAPPIPHDPEFEPHSRMWRQGVPPGYYPARIPGYSDGLIFDSMEEAAAAIPNEVLMEGHPLAVPIEFKCPYVSKTADTPVNPEPEQN